MCSGAKTRTLFNNHHPIIVAGKDTPVAKRLSLHPPRESTRWKRIYGGRLTVERDAFRPFGFETLETSHRLSHAIFATFRTSCRSDKRNVVLISRRMQAAIKCVRCRQTSAPTFDTMLDFHLVSCSCHGQMIWVRALGVAGDADTQVSRNDTLVILLVVTEGHLAPSKPVFRGCRADPGPSA